MRIGDPVGLAVGPCEPLPRPETGARLQARLRTEFVPQGELIMRRSPWIAHSAFSDDSTPNWLSTHDAATSPPFGARQRGPLDSTVRPRSGHSALAVDRTWRGVGAATDPSIGAEASACDMDDVFAKRASPTGTSGRCPRPVFACIGGSPAPRRPVDLAAFDSTVKVPTEGPRVTSHGTQAAAFLRARYSTVPACTPPDIESGWRRRGRRSYRAGHERHRARR